MSSLVPVMLLSLITSACGFSVGPEAPMVCVGGILGTDLGRRLGARVGSTQRRLLAVAGAAAALSAFLRMPMVGLFFALELLEPSPALGGGSPGGGGELRAFSPAAVASLAASVSLALVSSVATGAGSGALGRGGGAEPFVEPSAAFVGGKFTADVVVAPEWHPILCEQLQPPTIWTQPRLSCFLLPTPRARPLPP